MHRVVAAIASMLILCILTLGAQTAAQDATPAPVEPELSGDMHFREFADFGIVDAAVLQEGPVSIILFRIEFAPGASVTYPPGDPGLGIHLVESGTLTLRGFDADIVVTRAANEATPEAVTTEVLAAGAQTTLQPGDGFMWPPLAAGAFQNDGTEPVVVLISNLFPPAAANPAATPAS